MEWTQTFILYSEFQKGFSGNHAKEEEDKEIPEKYLGYFM